MIGDQAERLVRINSLGSGFETEDLQSLEEVAREGRLDGIV